MPKIPLLQVNYNELNSAFRDYPGLGRLLDAYNENFRRLDYLLNQNGIDSANMNNTSIEIKPDTTPENNAGTVTDSMGLNPAYMKFSPNKCYNSSFELFDSETLVPDYWDTDGVVCADAEFDSTYSLKLEPGKYAEQKEVAGEGLYDPDWCPWGQNTSTGIRATRVSFRCKCSGATPSSSGTYSEAVRLTITRGGINQPVQIWETDKDGNTVLNQYTSPVTLPFKGYPDWPWGLRSVAVPTSSGSGKLKVRFDNPCSKTIYIDSVIIEPDWTGKWPSFYTHGPHSIAAVGGTEYIEYGTATWVGSGVEFTMVNGYTSEPIVTASVQGTTPSEITKGFTLVVKHVQETIGETPNCYSKIQVIPMGESIPANLTDGKIIIHAICTGKVVRPTE